MAANPDNIKCINLDNDRLPTNEHTIGFRKEDNDEQIAFTRSFIQDMGVCNSTVGDKSIVVKYFSEYEAVAEFNGEIDGEVMEANEIDIFGNKSDQTKLQQEFLYSRVYSEDWMHYYPNTKLMI